MPKVAVDEAKKTYASTVSQSSKETMDKHRGRRIPGPIVVESHVVAGNLNLKGKSRGPKEYKS